MRGKKPIAKLVPLTEPTAEAGFRRIGGFEGLIEYSDSVFDPLTDEQMIEYGFDHPEKDAAFVAAINPVATESTNGRVTINSVPVKHAK